MQRLDRAQRHLVDSLKEWKGGTPGSLSRDSFRKLERGLASFLRVRRKESINCSSDWWSGSKMQPRGRLRVGGRGKWSCKEQWARA